MNRLLFLGFFSALVAAVAVAQPADMALLAASDGLLQPLRARLTGVQHEVHGGWELWRGQLAGKTVVLGRTEGDPMNAVAATTLTLQLHRPRLVVVFGEARAFDPALRFGDIVVSERFAAFDGMFSPAKGLGQGSAPLDWEPDPHLLMTAGEKETPTPYFPADATAEKAALQMTTSQGRVVGAVLGSAPQVNREADRITWLRAHWQVNTEDGESAYVAGCCALFHVPVIGFRVIGGSDEEVATFALRFVEASR